MDNCVGGSPLVFLMTTLDAITIYGGNWAVTKELFP